MPALIHNKSIDKFFESNIENKAIHTCIKLMNTAVQNNHKQDALKEIIKTTLRDAWVGDIDTAVKTILLITQDRAVTVFFQSNKACNTTSLKQLNNLLEKQKTTIPLTKKTNAI